MLSRLSMTLSKTPYAPGEKSTRRLRQAGLLVRNLKGLGMSFNGLIASTSPYLSIGLKISRSDGLI